MEEAKKRSLNSGETGGLVLQRGQHNAHAAIPFFIDFTRFRYIIIIYGSWAWRRFGMYIVANTNESNIADAED